MGQELSELVTTHIADVVHHGEKLILPEGMEIDQAIDVLNRRKKYLTAEVNLREVIPVFPLDGAYALSQVLNRRFGWAEGKRTRSMFGSSPPIILRIPNGVGTLADVPWGNFSLPNIQGHIGTDVEKTNDGRFVFELTATITRKDEATIRSLFADVREYVNNHSLYRGKAIKLRFKDDDGDDLALPTPEFMDTSYASPDRLVFSKSLEHMLEANLFTPITRVKDCIQNDIKVKRGILLGGPFGTGKTLAASVAAHLAERHNITYVYTPRADELSRAIAFAKQYQSPACVVFCEDIDRAVYGDRSVKMDDILNILDGIDTKSDNIITVLTTNHLERINRAMLRPGRLDAIIQVDPPNAEAVERLIRLYGGEAIPAEENLSEVGAILDGKIPAVIEETVKRAKLYQLGLSPRGAAVKGLTAEALLTAAQTMTTQIDLLQEKMVESIPSLDKAFREAVRNANN